MPEEGHTPLKPLRVDWATEQRVLGLQCSRAGFVAANLVHAFHPESATSVVFRMAGDIADLYGGRCRRFRKSMTVLVPVPPFPDQTRANTPTKKTTTI